ncbi:MAG: ABC transporter permease [Actinomycetota bacterium]|jgi:ribose transport system permease protein|nr:ABC transporter permease [Actinomycetota bacterium]
MLPDLESQSSADREPTVPGEESYGDTAIPRLWRGLTKLQNLDQSLFAIVAFVLLVGIFGSISPVLFTQAGWLAFAETAIESLLLATGQLFVILTGGIDLSDGAILGLSATLGAIIMKALAAPTALGGTGAVVVGSVGALAVGGGCGALNGFLIGEFGLTPFITTLGTLALFTGTEYLIDGGVAVFNLPNLVGTIGGLDLAGWLPVMFVVTVAVLLAFWWLLSKTRFGLWTYALGSNRKAAVRAGVGVRRHLVAVYSISGILAAVAALSDLTRYTAASTTLGVNDELTAIAAVIIGGVSLAGGQGRFAGAIAGALILSLIVEGLVLAGVSAFWEEVIEGAIVLLAVYLQIGVRGARNPEVSAT